VKRLLGRGNGRLIFDFEGSHARGWYRTSVFLFYFKYAILTPTLHFCSIVAAWPRGTSLRGSKIETSTIPDTSRSVPVELTLLSMTVSCLPWVQVRRGRPGK
jgi:hypothetical protein